MEFVAVAMVAFMAGGIFVLCITKPGEHSFEGE